VVRVTLSTPLCSCRDKNRSVQYVHTHVYACIHMCTHIYICMCIHLYVYIYIYIHGGFRPFSPPAACLSGLLACLLAVQDGKDSRAGGSACVLDSRLPNGQACRGVFTQIVVLDLYYVLLTFRQSTSR